MGGRKDLGKKIVLEGEKGHYRFGTKEQSRKTFQREGETGTHSKGFKKEA